MHIRLRYARSRKTPANPTETYENTQAINKFHITSTASSSPISNLSAIAYNSPSSHPSISSRHARELDQSSVRPYSQSRGASRLARSIQPRPGSVAETYIAYGMTQKLFEGCSSQADYSIPQISQKGAEVPKTAAGEDLGVSNSWWYKGSFLYLIWFALRGS